ncbi:MAG: hypothetical protein M0Z77_10590 [Thermoplasmatales archaeon]|nr:hypothetical protein [Thermoplasmatales archaeon]
MGESGLFGKMGNATPVTKRGRNLITHTSEIVNLPKWLRESISTETKGGIS